MSGVDGGDPGLWGVRLARLHKASSQFLNASLAPWGLGTGLHPYLLALEDGPCHQEVLSQRLFVDKANTARALAKLEALGLVTRGAVGGDKRLKQVALTALGVERLGPIKAALAAWEARLRQGLTAAEVAVVDRWTSSWG